MKVTRYDQSVKVSPSSRSLWRYGLVSVVLLKVRGSTHHFVVTLFLVLLWFCVENTLISRQCGHSLLSSHHDHRRHQRGGRGDLQFPTWSHRHSSTRGREVGEIFISSDRPETTFFVRLDAELSPTTIRVSPVEGERNMFYIRLKTSHYSFSIKNTCVVRSLQSFYQLRSILKVRDQPMAGVIQLLYNNRKRIVTSTFAEIFYLWVYYYK